MIQLLDGSKVQHLKVDGTNFVLGAGTSDVNSDVVDLTALGMPMSLVFLMTVGVLASGSSVTWKLQHSLQSGSGWEDVAGSQQSTSADTDDDKVMAIEITRPLRPYWRVVTTRGDGGNSTIESLFAIASQVRNEPVTQLTSAGQFISQPKKLASPISGTP